MDRHWAPNGLPLGSLDVANATANDNDTDITTMLAHITGMNGPLAAHLHTSVGTAWSVSTR